MKKTNNIRRADLFETINKLTKEDHFGIAFKKVNGEVREYPDCQVHIVPENAKGTGITAKEHKANYNNLMFYKNDGDESGYRIAKIANITEVTIGGKKFKVID